LKHLVLWVVAPHVAPVLQSLPRYEGGEA